MFGIAYILPMRLSWARLADAFGTPMVPLFAVGVYAAVAVLAILDALFNATLTHEG